jgi:hypothetical protein
MTVVQSVDTPMPAPDTPSRSERLATIMIPSARVAVSAVTIAEFARASAPPPVAPPPLA